MNLLISPFVVIMPNGLKMKVILLKNVDSLGKEGDIKDISDGYARNFLIPRQLADVATPELIRQIENMKNRHAKAVQGDFHRAESLAEQLEGKAFEIVAKCSKEGRLYAGIREKQIIEILKKSGYKIENIKIQTDHIKEVGEHGVNLLFSHGLEARIMLIVKKEE